MHQEGTMDDDHASAPYLVPSWLADSKPVHNVWSFLVVPLVEPLTNLVLPSAVTLPLVCLALLLLTWLWTAGDDDADVASASARHKRRARAKRRRRALWARLRALPATSILFAYMATATSQTAVSCGFLRLPPKISEADWFEHVRDAMRALVWLLKLTDLGVVACSVAFSDAALDWGVQKLTMATSPGAGSGGETAAGEGAGAGTAPGPLRWSVAAVTTLDLLIVTGCYASVVLSALLLFLSLLVWLTAQIPWLVYNQQINEKLRRSFLTRPLDDKIQHFFLEHEFVRVADDFKSLVLPFTAAAFLAQLNLLLSSWSLLLKNRSRLRHHSYLRQIGQRLHLHSLLHRLWAARAARAASSDTTISPLEVQLVAQEAPTVAEALCSAATRAKASVRNRRKRERGRRRLLVLQEQQQQEEEQQQEKGEGTAGSEGAQ